MSTSEIDARAILHHYRKLRAVVPVGPLASRAEYNRAVRTLDSLLDVVGDDGRHPLADLIETIGVFIERYEQRQFMSERPAQSADVLRLLMDEHELRQADLPEIGSQGVVSEILAGKRQLNSRQIRRLAVRFGVAPATFLQA